MDKCCYLNVFKGNLRQTANQMDILRTFQFYHDNVPKHKHVLLDYYITDQNLYQCHPNNHINIVLGIYEVFRR